TPNGYTSSVEGTNITNTHTPETTQVAGTKTWNDNNDQDGKRPKSITVNLLANGEVVQSQKVTADNNWTYTFTNLPKYANGKEIVYTVTENAVDNYTTTIDGHNITNSYTP
ncbi:Cna B-type domain-containing protein, partial [Streptococcus ruminantium]